MLLGDDVGEDDGESLGDFLHGESMGDDDGNGLGGDVGDSLPGAI